MVDRVLHTTLPQHILIKIQDICGRHQVELLDYVLRGRAGARILELYVDNVDGITHKICQCISDEVQQFLNSEQTVEDIVRLDVSSPGVERPLHHSWQYHKHQGRILLVTTTNGERHRGRLRSSSPTAIVLEEDDGIVTIPFSIITHAYVELEW